MAFERGVGYIVVDSLRRDRPRRAARSTAAQEVLIRRHARDPAVHALLRPDRPARLEVRLRDRGRAGGSGGRGGRAPRGTATWSGFHAHIGSQIFELEPYAQAIEVLAELCRRHEPPGAERRRRPRDRLYGGGRAAVDRGYVDVKVDARRARCSTRCREILIEPGRSLVGNAGVTALHGRHRQGDSRRSDLRRGRRRDVGQPAADALRLRATRR